MDAEEEEVALDEGMPVKNEEGEDLGTLGVLLIDEGDEDENPEFLLLRVGAVDRLVPFEAVLGVGDGNLVLDVPVENVPRFPALQEGADPTPDEMELAYKIYDEGSTASDDEDDDEEDEDDA